VKKKQQKKRNIAKTINFGLLYGMGSKKLADTLKITPKEAKVYIDSYFEAFTNVKEYMKSIEDFALENGYVETLIKRRRIFDFNAANTMQRIAFLREAVNTKFQGSAADLIKLSMIKIFEKYKNNNDLKMILQIHDELIFEVKNENLDEITNDLKKIMEDIFTLEIPLKVSVAIGNSWGDLK
jgi:DNA polymerase-1